MIACLPICLPLLIDSQLWYHEKLASSGLAKTPCCLSSKPRPLTLPSTPRRKPFSNLVISVQSANGKIQRPAFSLSPSNRTCATHPFEKKSVASLLVLLFCPFVPESSWCRINCLSGPSSSGLFFFVLFHLILTIINIFSPHSSIRSFTTSILFLCPYFLSPKFYLFALDSSSLPFLWCCPALAVEHILLTHCLPFLNHLL